MAIVNASAAGGYHSEGASTSSHSPGRGSFSVGEGAVHVLAPVHPLALHPLTHLGGAVGVGEGAVHVLAPMHPGLVLAQRQLLDLVVQVLVAGRGILQMESRPDIGPAVRQCSHLRSHIISPPTDRCVGSLEVHHVDVERVLLIGHVHGRVGGTTGGWGMRAGGGGGGT